VRPGKTLNFCYVLSTSSTYCCEDSVNTAEDALDFSLDSGVEKPIGGRSVSLQTPELLSRSRDRTSEGGREEPERGNRVPTG